MFSAVHPQKNGWADAHGVKLPSDFVRTRSARGTIPRTRSADTARSLPGVQNGGVPREAVPWRPSTSPAPQITAEGASAAAQGRPHAVRPHLHASRSKPPMPTTQARTSWGGTANTARQTAVQGFARVVSAPDSPPRVKEQHMPRRIARAGSAVWQRVSSAVTSEVSEDEEASDQCSSPAPFEVAQRDLRCSSKRPHKVAESLLMHGEEVDGVDCVLPENVQTEAGEKELDMFRRKPGPEQALHDSATAPVPVRPTSSPVHMHRRRRSGLADVAASEVLSSNVTHSHSLWSSSKAATDDFLSTYLLKGKVNERLSTAKRQVIIIDDRRPLTADMMGVNLGGGLALPPKKVPSSVGVRERELLIEQRRLDQIANMFLQDRETGGPEMRRKKALGEDSWCAADLRKELDGIHTAVCPTCDGKIDPQHQHHFCVQELLSKQEKWEEDGCFGHAPNVTCRHKHSHTAYTVLSTAAERRRKRKKDQPQVPNSVSPGLSGWDDGESTSEVLQYMKPGTEADTHQALAPHAPIEARKGFFPRKREHVAAKQTSEKQTSAEEAQKPRKIIPYEERNSNSKVDPSDKEARARHVHPSETGSGRLKSSDGAFKSQQARPHETEGHDSKPGGKKPVATLLTQVATGIVGDREKIEQVHQRIAEQECSDAKVLACSPSCIPYAHTRTNTQHTQKHAQDSECALILLDDEPKSEDFCLQARVEEWNAKDQLLREKLHQLDVAGAVAIPQEEADLFDPDAEIVRVFGGTLSSLWRVLLFVCVPSSLCMRARTCACESRRLVSCCVHAMVCIYMSLNGDFQRKRL